jgi:hypothetical protein
MNQWWRLGGVLGIAFIIAFIIGGIVLQGETPYYDDPIEEVRAYWEDDAQSYLIGDYIIGVAVMLGFLPFLVCLSSFLGRLEREPQLLSRLGLYGGLAFVIMTAAAASTWITLAFASEQLEDESIRLIMFLDLAMWNAIPFFTGLFLLAFSLMMVRIPRAWRFIGAFGLIVGVLALLAPLGILDDDPEDFFDILGFIAFAGLAIWLLATSIALAATREEPVAVERPARVVATA